MAFVLPASLTGRTVYVHDLSQIGGTVVGAAITVRCVYVIGKQRLIVAWYPTAAQLTPTDRSRNTLIVSTLSGLAFGVAISAATFDVGGAQDLIIRTAECALLGVLIGCVVARPPMQSESVPDGHGRAPLPAG